MDEHLGQNKGQNERHPFRYLFSKHGRSQIRPASLLLSLHDGPVTLRFRR